MKTSSQVREVSPENAPDKTRSKSKAQTLSGGRTERKNVSERMRTSEIRYRRLFEAANDGVLILDSISRKIIDANPFTTELPGYTRDELPRTNLLKALPKWPKGTSSDEFKDAFEKHLLCRALVIGLTRYSLTLFRLELQPDYTFG